MLLRVAINLQHQANPLVHTLLIFIERNIGHGTDFEFAGGEKRTYFILPRISGNRILRGTSTVDGRGQHFPQFGIFG